MAKYKLENNPLFTPEQEEEIKRQEAPGRGRPKKDNLKREGAQAGLPENYTRATFIVNLDILEQVKDYAYTERLSMKDAVNKLLSDSLEAYKQNGGTLLKRKGGNSDD